MAAINQLSVLWWEWMREMLWQASLLIVFISVLDIFLRRWAWPQLRHALWLLVLIKLILPPSFALQTGLFSYVSPTLEETIVGHIAPLQLDVKERSASTKVGQHESSAHAGPLAVKELEDGDPISNNATETIAAHASEAPSILTIIMFVWILGIIGLISLFIGKMMRLRHWHKLQQKQPIPQWFHELLVDTAMQFQITRLPAIVFNDKAISPAVYGLFRPVMLLPTNYFNNLSKEEAHHVLLHELAHLKRGDLWLNGLMLFMQIVYWINPLMVLVRRQMKHVREICCDLTVANVLREKTPAYRQTLLNTARELLTETVEPGLGLLGVFEEPFRLVTRLKWLEKKSWEHRKKIMAATVFISLVVAVCVLPMAAPSGESSKADVSTVEVKTGSIFDGLPKILPPNQHWTSNNFRIITKPAMYAVVLPRVGDANIDLENALAELQIEMKKQRIKPLGDPFGRFLSDPKEVATEQRYWEVCCNVKAGKKVKPPLEIRQSMSLQVASFGVAGKKNTDETWDMLVEALLENNYVPCFPPAIEIWRGEKYDKPFWQYTEMQIPVYHADSGYPGIAIEIEERPGFTAIVQRIHGSTDQLEEEIKKLKKYVRKNKIKTTGSYFAEYHYDWSKSAPSEWEWLVGVPISKDVDIDYPYTTEYFETGTIATSEFKEKPYNEYYWSPFVNELIRTGYMPVGAAMESWAKINGKKTNVEMSIPVMHMKAFSNEMPESTDSVDVFANAEKMREILDKLSSDSTNVVINRAREINSKINREIKGADLREAQRAVEKANRALQKALLRQDLDAYMAYVADDIISNPQMHSEVIGAKAFRKSMEDDIRRGIKFRTFNFDIIDCWQCDGKIYEVSTFAFSITSPESSKPWVANGKSFSIWRQESDGSLKVEYSIYNTDAHPNAQ
jgi:beta-lactamase regulating signal transducer with metallopeptidase domain/ketosteroid isomerase-like protein/DNA gyrase inhibitor GyrI